MRIVISGGLGYVGGRLSEYFAQHGHEVTALSRQAGKVDSINFPTNMRVLHPEAVMADTAEIRGADVFIHLAAMNENDCVKYPEKAIEVNIARTLQWLDLANNAGIPKFIYFSTAHVYGKPLEGHYDENTITRPVHPYAITHKCAEDYVLAYSSGKGMSNTVVRLTNSFGGAAFPTANRWTLLVSDLCRSAVNTGKMTLLGDGTQLRDFICLHDVCAATAHLMNLIDVKTSGQIFNLGAGHSISVWDMAMLVKHRAEEVLGRPIDLIRKFPSGFESVKLTISIEKLLSSGFTLKNDVECEINSTIQYFKTYAT